MRMCDWLFLSAVLGASLAWGAANGTIYDHMLTSYITFSVTARGFQVVALPGPQKSVWRYSRSAA